MEDTMKTAIITGANSSIGEAITRTLAEAGWRVVGLTRQDCDLADLAAVSELAGKLREEHMVIDALIHVAGVWHDQDQAFVNRDLEDCPPEMIAETMNVGVTSFMILAAKLMPNIAKNGLVVGVSGSFGMDHAGASGWLPYFTGKRALEDFLVGLAHDYPSGPLVFGISPADTQSAAYNKFFPEQAKAAQPPNSVSLLLEHLVTGQSPYSSGDIIIVKDKKAAKGYHL